MWIPAYLQERGTLESKLQTAGFLAPPTSAEFASLAFRWSLELGVIVLAEILVIWWLEIRHKKYHQKSADFGLDSRLKVDIQWSNARTIAIILILVGFVSTIVLPAPGLESRGLGGQGIQTMLRTCLVSGLALLVYFRCFQSKLYFAILIGGTTVLVLANVRSPLVVLFLAYIASEISIRRSGFSGRRSAALLILLAAVALLGSFMSTMRANITRNLGLSFSDVLSDTFGNPLIGIYQSGVDSLDGYRFSSAIAQYELPRPSDLALAITTFIPRSIWTDKPNAIGVDVSTKYLGYQSSGQFLSPVGYFNLVWGSYAMAVLSLFLISLIFAALIAKYYSSFWLCILLVVVFRFLIGGSSFDIYYGLVLVIPVVLVKCVVSWEAKSAASTAISGKSRTGVENPKRIALTLRTSTGARRSR
ncbi:hypothetical protein [Rhodococcus sp. NPDC076796]|uniref:hypothetical protein n=1 Tax=Rhodococcus sp. NPDC076796 TaxID=3154859 RepID=UPI00344FE389